MGTKFDTLRMLHIADSAFPSGSFAFSQGLEASVLMHQERGAFNLASWIECQIRHRWACFERLILLQGYQCADDIDKIMALDAACEANSLVEELRTGSRRNGRALLTSYQRIGLSVAADYLALVKARKAHGHLPVVQALLWCRDGVAFEEAELISAYQGLMGLIGAALRLNLIGAIEAQGVIRKLLPKLAEIIAHPIDNEFGFYLWT